MMDWKRIGKRLLFPGKAVLLAGVPAAAVMLIWAFTAAEGEGLLAYGAYAFSAYMTVAVCARLPRLAQMASARAHRNPLLHRCLTEPLVRMQATLRLSLGLNLLYAVMKLIMGVYYRSVWFGTLGVYYALLAGLRIMLLRPVRRDVPGGGQVSELKRYRLCGAALMPMIIVLSGVVALVIRRGEGFTYPGHLIYAAALYAFCAVIIAAVNLVRYRRYNSPVITAVKAVSLASALVSVFALETAMLAQFGQGEDPAFHQAMTSATGAGVCEIILGMAAVMIIRATRRLKELQAEP